MKHRQTSEKKPTTNRGVTGTSAENQPDGGGDNLGGKKGGSQYYFAITTQRWCSQSSIWEHARRWDTFLHARRAHSVSQSLVAVFQCLALATKLVLARPYIEISSQPLKVWSREMLGKLNDGRDLNAFTVEYPELTDILLLTADFLQERHR